MFLELILAIIIGVLLGIICGLAPGIHTNTVAAVIVSLSPILLEYFPPLTLAAAIAAVGVTQESLNCIPAIFLGAPDSDNALSVLPGHKLLLEGRGCEAIMLSTSGSFLSLIASILLVIPFTFLAQKVYPFLAPYTGYILVILCIFLLAKGKDKIWTIIIFLLSGALGYVTLGLNSKEPLLPLFSGLFGISMLLLSWKENTKIPEQKKTKLSLSLSAMKDIIFSSIAGWICAFMPGLGPSQAAALTSQFSKKQTQERFLFVTGGLATANFVISFITLYAIDKARSGAVVAVSKLVTSIDMAGLLLLLSACLLAGGISTIITPSVTNLFAKAMAKVDYKKLCIFTILFLIFLVIVISGALGMVILFAATSLGIVTNIKGIRKSAMMGCLLIPVIIWFLFG